MFKGNDEETRARLSGVFNARIENNIHQMNMFLLYT